jgi:hypothetical protein
MYPKQIYNVMMLAVLLVISLPLQELSLGKSFPLSVQTKLLHPRTHALGITTARKGKEHAQDIFGEGVREYEDMYLCM